MNSAQPTAFRHRPGFSGLILALWLAGPTAHTAVLHPLDPLDADEVTVAAGVVRSDPRFTEQTRFPEIRLQEPEKADVLAWQPGQGIPRAAFVVCVDLPRHRAHEVVVDLAARRVISWNAVTNGQPMMTGYEFEETARLLRGYPPLISALAQRGIRNLDQVTIAAAMPGATPLAGPGDAPLRRVLFWWDPSGTRRRTGHPIEGLDVVVDVGRMQVAGFKDHGGPPVSRQPVDFFDRAVRGPDREQLRPLVTTQPRGASFTVNGHEVRWDRWRFHLGFSPREGLILNQVAWVDAGRPRSILYRGSVSELLVPYGDPSPGWDWRHFIDEGEYGLGHNATALIRGQTTVPHATLLDAIGHGDDGLPVRRTGIIELYEREGRGLWNHSVPGTGESIGRRARELVVGFQATLGNYDYRFNWTFHQDATLEFEVELNGHLQTRGVVDERCAACARAAAAPGDATPAEAERFGTLLTTNLVAVNHQHFFNLRLDLDIDGVTNAVREANAVIEPPGPAHPGAAALVTTTTVFAREKEAMRDASPATRRSWAVFDPRPRPGPGHLAGYVLEPGPAAPPFLAPDHPTRRIAGFIDHPFFATRYHPRQRFAAGDYPSQAPIADNVQTWANDDESIYQADVVVWYTLGLTHLPRPEDHPVMPSERIGFRLTPKGFFDRNPALDVPGP